MSMARVGVLLSVLGSALVVLWLALAPGLGQALWRGDGPRANAQIQVHELPPEARQTLLRIKQGGPFPFRRDGSIFSNREGRLPRQGRGYYREYAVITPGSRDRGARRIIAGRAGDYWYTADHYRSFRRIKEFSGE
jgi:ribonuclease T1